jgi:autotransporter-associated beta strand protein
MKSALENVTSVVLAAALSHLAFAAHAETSTSPVSTWHIKPGAASWQSPDSYEESGVPSPGDTVVITSAVPVAVDDNSIAFVSSLGKIYMPSSSGSFTVDISTNATLDCQVSGLLDVSKEVITSDIGTVRKKGAGELYLSVGGTSDTLLSQYYVNWEIENGSLRMPTNSASSTSRLFFGVVTVHKDATLFTAKPGRTRITELWGEGMVTNVADSSSYYLDVYGLDRIRPCEFHGVIGGGIYMYSRGNVNLMGTNNTYRGGTWTYYFNDGQERGTTGLRKIGMSGEPSSSGIGGALRTRERSGRFLYLGEGETTDKEFQFDESTTCPCEVNAGAFGGVTFTGKWSEWTDGGTAKNSRLVLSGSNTAECVLANEFKARSSYTTRITKKGSGTWRLAHHASRKNTGVVAVQDGTLKFDSIAEKGTVCSLGLSTMLYRDNSGAAADTNKVDYALMVGGDSSKTGTLEYAGLDRAFCTTRPLAVAGAGRLRTGKGSGELVFKGVFADADGGTLIFDAANDATNRLADVTDGKEGALSLTKEGSGVLALAGSQTWRGNLDVREGELLIDSHYDYWRFTMKENAYACTRYDTTGVKQDSDAGKRIFGVSEFALYSVDGVRRNSNMSITGEVSTSKSAWNVAATNLPPGYAAFENGSSLSYYLNNGHGRLDNLFDGSLGSDNGIALAVYSEYADFGLHNPNSYARVIMRLAEGTDEIEYFDIGNSRKPNSDYFGRCLTAYSLEASADGMFWEKVAEDNEAVIPATASSWYGDNDGHTTLKVNRSTPLANVASVRVRTGAKLTANGPVAPIRKLVLDEAGAGTIDGFEFAEEGEIEIPELTADGSFAIALSVENSASFANVTGWSVVSGGKVKRLSVAQTASGLEFRTPGLKIIVR